MIDEKYTRMLMAGIETMGDLAINIIRIGSEELDRDLC